MVPPCACWEANAQNHTSRLPSLAALFPTQSRGESAPAASAATWDGRTATPRHTIDSQGPPSQVTLEFVCGRPRSIRKPGAVVDRVDEVPTGPGIGAYRLED